MSVFEGLRFRAFHGLAEKWDVREVHQRAYAAGGAETLFTLVLGEPVTDGGRGLDLHRRSGRERFEVLGVRNISESG